MVVGFAYVLASLGKTASIPANVGPFLGVIFGLALVAHLANRWLVPDATPVILPIAALLNGIGYVVIARLNFKLAGLQAVWTGLGVAVYVLTLVVVPVLYLLLKRTEGGARSAGESEREQI